MPISSDIVGSRVDIAPFGIISFWTGSDRFTIERHDAPSDGTAWLPVDAPEHGGPHIGLEWECPRRFSMVEVRYAKQQAPSPGMVKLQYWNHTWPEQWAGGWTAVEDAYNGKWVTAHDNVEIVGDVWRHTFDPLDIVELPHAEDFSVKFRQSLKLRLLFHDTGPRIEHISVFSDSIWRKATLRVEFGINSGGITFAGNVEVYNGYLLSMDESNPKAIVIEVLYADVDADFLEKAAPLHPDATVVTVKCRERSFSFQVTDALNSGVYIPDFGVFVGKEGSGGFKQWRREGVVSIYDRVAAEPEQTYERASAEIPQLWKTRQGPYGRYCPIGCDANRQEFAVRYNGDIFADKSLLKLVGRDAARLLWPGKAIWFKFPSGEPPDFREREDATSQSPLRGYLPIYLSQWMSGDIQYKQTTFAALLYESPWQEESKRGDEPVVALSRVAIRNMGARRQVSRLWLVIENPELLVLDKGFVYATGRARDANSHDPSKPKKWIVEPYDSPRMRAFIDTRRKGAAAPSCCSYSPLDVVGINNAIAYDVELEPGQEHEIEFRIPFITFTGNEGVEAVRALNYELKLEETIEYWEAQINSGAAFCVPEQLLNDFNRANLCHIAITADKDVDTGLYMLGAGTWDYQVFGTETVDQVRSLDLRGYHERARKYIMPFVELQGSRRMDGRFKSQEGALHGLRVSEDYDYQVGDYSLDHGTILWMLGEHYRLTRDKVWLSKIAQNMVDACDYVIRERQASMRTAPDGSKVWEYGLLPPCHLDDNPEWKYWYIVNALCYKGMKSTADVLKEIGHHEAERISCEARAYGEDIRRAIAVSMERSPVVKLLDGSWIPHLPVRAYLRGRDVGWIRDSLYGPIFNIDCGLIEPNSIEATWILKDYEDNVFVSRSSGRDVDLEHFWFSHGGITIQSNLLPNPLVYLVRGQVEHALRAFYNSFAANLYADVRCFTEHPVVAYGWGAGPFYKTPDESAFLTWFRYLLLMESEDALLLCPGTPRKWLDDGKEIEITEAPTYFGPVSYRVVSEASKGRIFAEITPPRRNPPASLKLKLRHPSKLPIKSVKINGMPWSNFDMATEIISIPMPLQEALEVIVEY